MTTHIMVCSLGRLRVRMFQTIAIQQNLVSSSTNCSRKHCTCEYSISPKAVAITNHVRMKSGNRPKSGNFHTRFNVYLRFIA